MTAIIHTEYEWCGVHKSAEFAFSRCAVAALAPVSAMIPCNFVGTVDVRPLPDNATSSPTGVDQ